MHTGKTTLSADPHRYLIGDDEHGWDDEGVFNLEGGCYAKTNGLREEFEPEIFRAIRPDALLENIALEDVEGSLIPNYDDIHKTENGRVSYPIYHISNHFPSGMGNHPRHVIFLTCDAFGVLPPVAKLSNEQAMYHFLSGYTAKVAGTERGISKPVETFSACFGAAFMTLHPTRYADLLQQKLKSHDCKAYLINTGWSGGEYGVGKRMSIKTTRTCVQAILTGTIEDAVTYVDPVFRFEVPVCLDDVPANVCDPREAWEDKEAYDNQRSMLAGLFIKNYEKYRTVGVTDYSAYGPLI